MIKHGIIGCGRVAKNHVHACQKLRNVSLTHFCDLDLGKAKSASSYLDNPVLLNDYQDLIDSEIHSVSICTDHGSHFEIAKACIHNKKHVLIEKPICISDKQAIELLEIINHQNGVICSVVSQHRYDPLVNQIYKLSQNGVFGKIVTASGFVQCSKTGEYYSGWRGKMETEGGSALINQGIHTLDILIWMCGEIQKVKAISDNLKFEENETEDTIGAICQFASGSLGTLICTTASSVEWESYVDIVGTAGSIRFTTDFPNKILNIEVQGNDEAVKRLHRIEAERVAPPVGQHYYGISHDKQLENFFNAILGKEDLKVSVEDGIRTLRGVNMIYASTRR